MSGLTEDGFERKTLDEILEDTNARQRAAFGPEWDTSPAAPDGVMNGIDASQKDEVWQGLEAVHASFDPDKATGASQDALYALSGVTRRGAKRSTAPGTANLDGGASVAAQALVVSVSGAPAIRFRNRFAIENLGVGADDIPVTWESVDTGVIVANNGTLTVIESPVSGVNSVTNTADATPGRNVESNSEFRIRWLQEMRAQGGSVPAAIKADLLQVDGVSQAFVLYNNTMATVDGIPPKSVECVVSGGADADVAQAVFDAVAAGIGTHGNTTGSATDQEGDTQTVKWTRPTEIDVYIEVDVETGPGYIGDIALKQAVALYGNQSHGMGDDVIVSKLYGPLFNGWPQPASPTGVTDVTEIRIGTAPSPVGTSNLAIGTREIARFDTSRIEVNP